MNFWAGSIASFSLSQFMQIMGYLQCNQILIFEFDWWNKLKTTNLRSIEHAISFFFGSKTLGRELIISKFVSLTIIFCHK